MRRDPHRRPSSSPSRIPSPTPSSIPSPTPSVTPLAIDSIAAGGDGVSRLNGLVVFTPRTAPGDVAEIEITPGKRFARGALKALVTPGAGRVTPRCEHYTRDRCGGCQLQHLDIASQRAAKSQIVADALRRIGHVGATAPEVRASPSEWRYRRKLTLALRRRGREWFAGMHPYDGPGKVFPLNDCPITDERVIAVWKEVLAAQEFLPDSAELRGAVQLDSRGASFVLEGGVSWPGAAEFFEHAPSLVSLWYAPAVGVRRRVAHREHDLLPNASFVQVNEGMARTMQQYVVDRVLAHTPATVVDAYAGAGDTAAALADAGVKVTAIELDEDAAAWCAGRLPAGSRAIAARVEDILARVLPAEVVILNPPRAGVDAKVVELLANASAGMKAVVYVSCDPATLARDIARLPGWRVASLAAFDMFPQTAHVETVCELVPEAA